MFVTHCVLMAAAGMDWTNAKAKKGGEWQFFDIHSEGWMDSSYPEAAWLASVAYDDPTLWQGISNVEGFDPEYFKRDAIHLYMKRPAGVKGVDED